MKIAICDDNKQEHIHLERLLQAYQSAKGNDLICDSFYNGLDLVDEIREHPYDLLLLDVVMPNFSGLQAAKEIRLFNGILKIVFLSASSEFAMDSYTVGAYGYLLKPVKREDLFALLDKICAEVDHPNMDSLVIKSRESIVRIPFCSIEYVEVMNKTVSFHLIDETVRKASASLLDFEPQLLSRMEFLKTHRSYLVNMGSVQTLNAQGILTQTGHSIPISKMLYAQVKEAYLKYLFISQPSACNRTTVPAPNPFVLPPVTRPIGTYRILLVDDDPDQQRYWSHLLQINDCIVDLASDGKSAVKAAAEATYDCILLDVLLFGERSFSHCEQLRTVTNAPIIFLSVMTDNDSQLQGFLSGGNDYISKDIPPDLFWAKIEARIRPAPIGSAQRFFDPLVLDLSLRKARIDDVELVLTPTEFDLLWLLAEHPDRVYTPEELYHAVWGAGPWDGGQSIQVHLSRMRQKLKKAYPLHCFIQTAWGKGYRFVPNAKTTPSEAPHHATV